MKAVFSFGDFVMARDIHVTRGNDYPPQMWRLTVHEKIRIDAPINESVVFKYLEFDLVDVGREVAFYEFSRIVG